MNETPVISVHQLSVKAGVKYLLKDICWTVMPGEHWLIFGMNGSGKTTLLSVLAGYRQATAGQVSLFGERYTAANILDLRRRIAWVSGSFFDTKYTRESALDIVLSGASGALGRDAHAAASQDAKRARALLKELHIGHKLHQPFHMMSKGERANVLIARTLMAQPEILLLDEPCSGLDIYAREYFLNTIADLAKRRDLTLIYVTHYTEEILTDVFQHALLLKNGLVFRQGATTDLFTDAIISDFLEVPAIIAPGAFHGLDIHVEAPSQLAAMMAKEAQL